MPDVVDPDDAKFVVEFMEKHTKVTFGDMIGRKDRDRILAAAGYAAGETSDGSA